MIFSERMVTQNNVTQNNIIQNNATQNSLLKTANQKYAYLTTYLRHAHPWQDVLLNCQ